MTSAVSVIERHPWRTLLVFWPIATVLYGAVTRVPVAEPFLVRPTALDAMIPFVPWAAGPYLTYFALPVAVVLIGRGRDGFGGIFLAALAAVAASIAINLGFPAGLLDPPTAPPGSLLAFIERTDTPYGALPSGHVALPAAIATAFAIAPRAPVRGRLATAVFIAWTVVLAACALLTKQHYMADVVSGLIVGVVVAAVAAVAAAPEGTFHVPTLRALAAEWIVIVIVAAAALRWWSAPVALLAMLVIATRQHGLFILFHDGVHGLVARPQRRNDVLINLAVGVPLLVPVHLYRAVHLAHHRDLGTERDPERVLLYHAQPWRYRPLALGALALQFAGDTLGWNNIIMAVRFFRVRGDPNSPLKMAPTRAYPELAALIALVVSAWTLGLILAPQMTVRLALLWFVPYFTALQLLQKVRSFAEHAGEGSGDSLTYSWAPGLLGRLTIWPYNINYHFEHHERPGVPWDELPALAPSLRRRPGRELVFLLWSGAHKGARSVNS